ncbi:MAG: hypothetical protein KIG95_03875 [Comamonas sp.]|nr:hypothetical protein [Comamonas sp.]
MQEDENTPSPEQLLAYLLEEQVQIKASVSVLEAQVQAQAELINALALAIPAHERPAVLALLQAQAQTLESEGQSAVATFLQAQAREMVGLMGQDLGRNAGEAAAALGLVNALVQSAAPEHAAAMRTWLTIATDAELAQDALQVPPERLAALLRLQVGQRLAGQANQDGAKPERGDGA